MQNILLLGAGLVTRPLVNYLLGKGYHLTNASRTLSKAQALVGDHPNGKAVQLNVQDTDALEALIKDADVAISLLPYTHHVKVAKLCIKHKVHFVSTSYVSKEMAALDQAAKDAGVIVLNELGVDPGIDHMSAKKIIDWVHGQGGQIRSFRSYCGGLPAPEANDNPFGYKFSWSPIGVLLAGTNDARYKEDGKIVEIPGKELFSHYKVLEVEGLGKLEGYPNRDSVPYIDTYGIHETDTCFRGTYRNLGWCDTLKAMADLGILDKTEKDFTGKTLAQIMTEYVGGTAADVRANAAARLGMKVDDPVLDRLAWLGLFSDETTKVEKGSMLEVLADVMLRKMSYKEGERDMLVLTHDFIAELPDGKKHITSTMIDYGIPHGDSSMARTVSLPAAIATHMVLQGKITRPGVYIPVDADIYEPILAELETLDIRCVERYEDL